MNNEGLPKDGTGQMINTPRNVLNWYYFKSTKKKEQKHYKI